MTQAVATHGTPPGQETADSVALGTDESAGGSGLSVATAFRRVEKRYQLKRDQVFRRRNGRRYCSGMVARPADLSDVLDLRLLPGLDTCAAPAFTPQQKDSLISMTSADGFPTVSSVSAIADKVGADIVQCADDSSSGPTVVSFAAFPGLHILPGFLTPEEQRELAVMCLEEFPEPPSHSNHTVHLGPLQGLWGAARSGLRLHPPRKGEKKEVTARSTGEERREGGVSAVEASGAELGRHTVCRDSYDGRCWCRDGSGKTAASCLDKLRWVTIGPQYDWTQVGYRRPSPPI
jgi:alkylated DNA repair protein alkB family protein 1